MLYKKNKSRLHKFIRRFLIIFIVTSIILTVLFEMQAIPFTSKCVRKQSKTVSTKIIGNAVVEVLEELDFSYDDLANINYSDSGQVNSISANSININRVKSKVVEKIQSELDKNKLYKFTLPLGAFTNLTMISTFGPEVEINFTLTGSVNCKIKSSFESSGVNQTIHHINLVVKTDIITISPEYRKQNTFKTDYEIAQTVIVGSVPSMYADVAK
ncbi:MAG: sporulation protein YunB [Ruminococcus sp.]|nr:sporulation protein YunB [Ruminococcus sp.]